MIRVLLTWIVTLGLASTALAQVARWTAQDLSRHATIGGTGGMLVLFDTPDAQAFPFTSGQALTFTPTGKGSFVEFTLPVASAGIYQLRLRSVIGPGCGGYRVLINDVDRGSFNLAHTQTLHMDRHSPMRLGLVSKRAKLEQGNNRIRLELMQPGPRSSAVVIDTLQLEPAPSTTMSHRPTPYDTQPPTDEKLSANLVTNGDFESFTPEDQFLKQHSIIRNWTFNSVVPRDTQPIVRESSQSHSGRNALLLAPDELEDMAICFQNLPMEAGKRYRVSLWARGSGMLLVYFFISSDIPDRSTEGSANLANHFVASESWHRYTFIATMPAKGKFSQMMMSLYATSGSRVWFDDVTVQEIQSTSDSPQP